MSHASAPRRLLPLPDGTADAPRVGYAEGHWWVQTCVDDAPFRFEGGLLQLLRMFGTEGVTPDAAVYAIAALATRAPRLSLTPEDRARLQTTGTLSVSCPVDAGSSLVNGGWWTDEEWGTLSGDPATWRVDPGPSPAGNRGPYLKAPRDEDESVHRVYPPWQVGDYVRCGPNVLAYITAMTPTRRSDAPEADWDWVIQLSTTSPTVPDAP